jgi:hypothetical protein
MACGVDPWQAVRDVVRNRVVEEDGLCVTIPICWRSDFKFTSRNVHRLSIWIDRPVTS